jgi:deoxycytidine triphosphate deaminase
MNGNGEIKNNTLARTDEEAEEKFLSFKSKDPFQSIQSALLSSADIYDYVAASGMIYPFDIKNLKSASYEIPLKGKIFYWNGKNEDCSQDIGPGTTFTLPKNSIAFINLETKFRIPEYIALRFNLRITHVHQGLLLGTGPLIDPGFEGNILIPLHNLTSNEYTLKGGEGFIWVEFTKLNLIDAWRSERDCFLRAGQYIPFPESKKWKDAQYYLGKAAFGRNIRSSIPDVIINSEVKAKESADNAAHAAKEAGDARKRADINFWVTVVTIVLAIIGIIYTMPQIMAIIDTNSKIINETNQELRMRIESLEKKVKYLDNKTNQKDVKNK